jgi:hypothetical protein
MSGTVETTPMLGAWVAVAASSGELRARHAEGSKDPPLDVPLERHAGAHFHEVTGQVVAVVGVRMHPPGRPDPLRLVVDEVRPQPGAIVAFGFDQRVLEPAVWVKRCLSVMGSPGVAVPDLEPRQVLVDVGVEVELALLYQLHHRGRGEHLRHRVDVERRAFGDDRALVFRVGDAVPLREGLPSVRHHRDGGTWHPKLLELPRDLLVHELFHVVRAQRRDVRGTRNGARGTPRRAGWARCLSKSR